MKPPVYLSAAQVRDVQQKANLLLSRNRNPGASAGAIVPIFGQRSPNWEHDSNDGYMVDIRERGAVVGDFWVGTTAHQAGAAVGSGWTGYWTPAAQSQWNLWVLASARGTLRRQLGDGPITYRILSAYRGNSDWLAGSDGRIEFAVCVWSGDAFYGGDTPKPGVPAIDTVMRSDVLAANSAKWRDTSSGGVGASF